MRFLTFVSLLIVGVLLTNCGNKEVTPDLAEQIKGDYIVSKIEDLQKGTITNLPANGVTASFNIAKVDVSTITLTFTYIISGQSSSSKINAALTKSGTVINFEENYVSGDGLANGYVDGTVVSYTVKNKADGKLLYRVTAKR